MKRILIENMMINIKDDIFKDIDIDTVLKKLMDNIDDTYDLANKKEYKIEYAVITGICSNEVDWHNHTWLDCFENLDDAVNRLKWSVLDALRKIRYLNIYDTKANVLMPYLTILIDGYDVVKRGILDEIIEYKDLLNKTWFDLNKEEQNFLMENFFKFKKADNDENETDEDYLENSMIYFDSFYDYCLYLDIDMNSKEDNFIFLEDEKFHIIRK